MNFRFYLPTDIHFGQDSLEHLVHDIETGGFGHIAIVYDHNIANHPLLSWVLGKLKTKTMVTAQAVQKAEPTYDFLDSFREHFMDRGIEAVVGIGGGSTLDTAKAMAVLVHNREPAVAYRGFNRMTEPVLPVFACPTTAGTGSEITPNASFIDGKTKKKLGINGEAIRPRSAYLHPGFIITCPTKPAAYAAIDALVHAIEAFAAQKATPPSRMFARTAVALLVENIVPSIKEKKIEAVENVFWASLLAAVAMMHSGTGPTAALSYPLGVHGKVPHGLAGAVFLPQVMQWNVAHGYQGYGNLLETEHIGDSQSRSLDLVNMLTDIWRSLDIPEKAGEVGFTRGDIDLYLADLGELRGAIDQNPLPMTDADLRELLLASL